MRYYTTDLPRITVTEALQVAPVTDEYQGHIHLTIGSPYNSTVSLPITSTRPFYGGYRVWFECPVSDCGRKTPHLYVQDGRIACRKCLHLKYETQDFPVGTAYGFGLAMLQTDRIRETGRRLWYGGKPTRIGRRYIKLYETAQPTFDMPRPYSR